MIKICFDQIMIYPAYELAETKFLIYVFDSISIGFV